MTYSVGNLYVRFIKSTMCPVSAYAELWLINTQSCQFFDTSVRGYKFREGIKLKCLC